MSLFSILARRLRRSDGTICKIFSKWRDGFSAFGAFRPGWPPLSRIKAPPHHPQRNDPVASWLMSPPTPGHGGSDGIFGHSHALRCNRTCLGACLSRTRRRSRGRPRLFHPNCRNRPADPPNRSAFGLNSVLWVPCGKMARRRAHSSTTKGCNWRSCDGDRDRCVSRLPCNFSPFVDNAKAREGRARLGEINRAIQSCDQADEPIWLSTAPSMSGVRRSSPSPVVAGDCEDYAIAKFVALRHAGISPAICASLSCATPSEARITPLPRQGWMGIG